MLDRGRRGASSVEFVLVAAFYFVPMILGTLAIGINLIRSMQAIEVTRDAGHMYAKAVDFSQTGNQNILVNQIGDQLGLQGNGGTNNVTGGTAGKGVIILSTITYLTSAQCTGCPNTNHYVVTNRIVIGNKNIYTSRYGTNLSSTVDSSGNIENFTTNTNAQADSFSHLLTLTGGQYAYLAESYFNGPGLVIPGVTSSINAYNYAVF
jgi:hypothetical protein